MKNEVYLLHTADEWLSSDSMRLLAAFTSMDKVLVYLEDSLLQKELIFLEGNMQTQGLELNYVILTEDLDPEENLGHQFK